MKSARLVVAGKTLISRLELAVNTPRRMRGLLGRASLSEGRGMFLSPCGSIHTLFMRFPIDVIFLDRNMDVVRVAKNVRPFRMAMGGSRARSAIEVQSGWLDLSALPPGARCILEFHDSVDDRQSIDPPPMARAARTSLLLSALLAGCILWLAFTWPLARHVGQAIAWRSYTTDRSPVRMLVPGDHLQLLYHFWLARDMLGGGTPPFANVYEFNTGDDRARAQPSACYAPFSLVYAAVAPWTSDAAGWNIAGLLSVLLGVGFLNLLARRHGAPPPIALAAAVVAAAVPYGWITLLGGSPTGYGMSLVPMLACGLDIAVRDGRTRGGWLAGAAIVAAMGSDLHVFYFSGLLAPLWCLVAWCAVPEPTHPTRVRLLAAARALWPTLLVAGIAVAVGLITSRQLAQTSMAGARTWDEIRSFSPAGRGLFLPHAPGMSRHIYLGFALPALLAAGLLAWLAERRRLNTSQMTDGGRGPGRLTIRAALPVALPIATLALVLALALGSNGPLDGAAMKLARRCLPGYAVLRQSAKVYCLLPTLLAVLLARVLPPLARRRGGRAAVTVLVLLALLDLRRPLAPGLCLLPARLPVYEAVTAHAAARDVLPRAVALPLWPGQQHESSRYEFAAMRSRVRFLNGYAPAVPSHYGEQVFLPLEALNRGELDAARRDRLRDLRIDYVIVHSDAFAEAGGPYPAAFVLRRLLASGCLEPVAQDGRVWAFALRPEIQPAPTLNPQPPTVTLMDGLPYLLPASDLFHACGAIDPDTGELLLDPAQCAEGLAAWSPGVFPSPTGRCALVFHFDSVAPSGSRLGDVVVVAADGTRLGHAPIVAGQPCRVTLTTDGRTPPLRVEIHYHSTGPLRAQCLELLSIPNPQSPIPNP